MIKWIKRNRDSVIRNAFLLPIILVVAMSISHIVSWYDIGNPLNWAIYLSISIEVFALSAVAAASIKAGKGSIWFLFGLVTAIQIVGNIFYEFKEINPTGEDFVAWMQLIEPLFTDWNVLDHRRFLAAIQGGTLPLMSLTALHFYIKFKENDNSNSSNDTSNDIPTKPIEPETIIIDTPEEVEIINEDTQNTDESFSTEITEDISSRAIEINEKAERALEEADVPVDSNDVEIVEEKIIDPEFHFVEANSTQNNRSIDNNSSRFEQPKNLDKHINPNTGKFKIS